jgi:hypothetical protein
MAKRITGQQMLDDMSSGGGINFREILIDLKPDKSTGKTQKKLRLIGLPIEYWEATARKRSEEDPKKTVQVAFPDAQLNKSYSRICDDDPEKDIWTQMGYVKSKRYAINCIDRDDGKVKILAKGKMIFREFYKAERSNIEENIELAENGEPLLWTMVGGEESPDVKIISIANEKALGGVEYEVHINPRLNKLTTEEIEKLRNVGCPNAEQLKEIRAANPDLDEMPDWFFYGYNLEEIFKPSVLRTDPAIVTEAPTPVQELDIAVDEEDKEEKEATKETTKKGSSKAKASEKSETNEETAEAALEEVEW